VLAEWYRLGVTTLLLSIVHYDPEKNREIYFPRAEQYLDLKAICDRVQGHGINVRFTCVGIDGYIDSVDELRKLLDFARDCGVRQLTWRPVSVPDESQDPDVIEWTRRFFIRKHQHDEINEYVRRQGKLVRRLPHGAAVFDLGGQNLCLSDCLTHSPDPEDQRQLIFFPDGRLYTDWQYRGSILL
jgi:hypothetical protein